LSTFSDSTSTNDHTLAPAGVTFARSDEGLLVAKVGDSAFALLPGSGAGSSSRRLGVFAARWNNGNAQTSTVTAAISKTRPRSERALRKMPSINASAPPCRGAKSRRVRRRHGVRPSMPSSMPTESSVIRRQAMAASISMPVTTTRRSILDFARAAAGMRKIAPGRLWRRPFRSYSRTMSGATRIGPSAIGTRTLGSDPRKAPEARGISREGSSRFERDHASDWIVISAIRCDGHTDMTECVATLGGDRAAPEQRRYLVPSDEYHVGRFGFVIDEARHPLYAGPSSLIGWNG